MKTTIGSDELAELNNLAAKAAGAQRLIEECVDKAEALLGMPNHPRNTDIADEFYQGGNVLAALQRMGITVTRAKSKKS